MFWISLLIFFVLHCQFTEKNATLFQAFQTTNSMLTNYNTFLTHAQGKLTQKSFIALFPNHKYTCLFQIRWTDNECIMYTTREKIVFDRSNCICNLTNTIAYNTLHVMGTQTHLGFYKHTYTHIVQTVLGKKKPRFGLKWP